MSISRPQVERLVRQWLPPLAGQSLPGDRDPNCRSLRAAKGVFLRWPFQTRAPRP